MNLKDIIAKVVAGKSLSAEEAAFLKEAVIYTQEELDTEATARATRARKKAEEQRDAMKAQVDTLTEQVDELKQKDGDKKWEAEKTRLTKENDSLKAQLAARDADLAKRTRTEKINAVVKRVGFISAGADGKPIMSERAQLALVEDLLREIETDDLDRDAVVNPLLKKLKEDNPHLIAAPGAGGSGHPPGGGAPQHGAYRGPNPWARDSFNLTTQGVIVRNNPELAAQLKQAAGVK